MSDVTDGGDAPAKSDEELAAEWAQAMEQDRSDGAEVDVDAVLAEGGSASGSAGGSASDSASEYVPAGGGQDAAELPQLDVGAAATGEAQNLDVVLDIPVRLSMEVGNTAVSIGELLRLNRGSVVELDRLAGEPLDVLVNGTLVAHGEVVVVNDRFGVRLIDVLSPQDRIKTLG